jgi:hypothetical protein
VRCSLTRILLLLVLAIGVPTAAIASALPAGAASGDAGDGSSTVTTIDNGFLDTERDLGECVNSSVQLPGCGHKTEDAGDRGGALQIATFAIMTLGLVGIGWRVTSAVRNRDRSVGSQPL